MTASIVGRNAIRSSGNNPFDITLSGTGSDRLILVIATGTGYNAPTLDSLMVNGQTGIEVAYSSTPSSQGAGISVQVFTDNQHPNSGTFTFTPAWSAISQSAYLVYEIQDAPQSAPFINEFVPSPVVADLADATMSATLSSSSGLLSIFYAGMGTNSSAIATASNVSPNLANLNDVGDGTSINSWIAAYDDAVIATNSETYSVDVSLGRADGTGDHIFAGAISINAIPPNQPPSADDDSFTIFTNAQVGDVVGTVPVSDSDGTVASASITGANFGISTVGQITVISTSGLTVGTITENATFTDNDGDSTVVTITVTVTAPVLSIDSIDYANPTIGDQITVGHSDALGTLTTPDFTISSQNGTQAVIDIPDITSLVLTGETYPTINFDEAVTITLSDGTNTADVELTGIQKPIDTYFAEITSIPTGSDFENDVGATAGMFAYYYDVTGNLTVFADTGQVLTDGGGGSYSYKIYNGEWGAPTTNTIAPSLIYSDPFPVTVNPPTGYSVVTLTGIDSNSWLNDPDYISNAGGDANNIGIGDQIVYQNTTIEDGETVVISASGLPSMPNAGAQTANQTIDWFYLDAQDGYAAGQHATLTLIVPPTRTHLLTQTIDLNQWVAGSSGLVRGNDKTGAL